MGMEQAQRIVFCKLVDAMDLVDAVVQVETQEEDMVDAVDAVYVVFCNREVFVEHRIVVCKVADAVDAVVFIRVETQEEDMEDVVENKEPYIQLTIIELNHKTKTESFTIRLTS